MDAPAHCAQLLRARDEDRWLAARYAPPQLQRKLTALYALHGELRRVPGIVSEPPLGEIRLQWHRDALNEIREGKPPRQHPVVLELADAGLAAADFAPLIETAIDAAARPLYGEGFSSVDDLFMWLGEAEGSVDALAVQLCGGDKVLADAAGRAGAAFAAAREGTVIAPGLADAAAMRAQEVWDTEKPITAAAPSACAPALAHLFLTPAYLKRGANGFPVVKRLKLFSAVAFGK